MAAVMLTAEPLNFERLGIVLMVHLCSLAADFAPIALEFASLERSASNVACRDFLTIPLITPLSVITVAFCPSAVLSFALGSPLWIILPTPGGVARYASSLDDA
jgi:hypothetical protein